MKISADASQCHKMKKEKKQQQHVRLETGYRENIWPVASKDNGKLTFDPLPPSSEHLIYIFSRSLSVSNTENSYKNIYGFNVNVIIFKDCLVLF